MSLSIKQTTEAPQVEKKPRPEDELSDVPGDPALPKHKGPLKGGVDQPSGGDQFGLKW
jgi:small subunit ribosomal protein S1